MHYVSFEFDGAGSTVLTASCDAPVGADCRLVCPYDCESWDTIRHTAGAYHYATEEYGDREIGVIHYLHDSGKCHHINASDGDQLADNMVDAELAVGRVPVGTFWDDGWCFEELAGDAETVRVLDDVRAERVRQREGTDVRAGKPTTADELRTLLVQVAASAVAVAESIDRHRDCRRDDCRCEGST